MTPNNLPRIPGRLFSVNFKMLPSFFSDKTDGKQTKETLILTLISVEVHEPKTNQPF